MSDEKEPEIQAQTSQALTVAQPYSQALRPRNVQEAMGLAEMLAKSSFVPPALRGKPGDVFAALSYGAELGLAPMQALHNVAVINGKPSLYGDGLVAVCQASPAYEWHEEGVRGEGDERYGFCTVKRRGRPEPVTTKFSVADAKVAGLWKKSGPWTTHPDRMLISKARGFGLRDSFSDALRGLISSDEASDYPNREPPQKAQQVEKKPVDSTVVHEAVIEQYAAKAGTNKKEEK